MALFAAEGPASVPFPILTAIIVLPAVGALAVALVPKARTELVRLVGVLFSVGTAALCAGLLLEFKRGVGGFQFVSSHSWISTFGISWTVGVDGISLFLVLLTGLLFPIAIVG